MKSLTLHRFPRICAATLALALLTAPRIHAATYYWDANDSTAGFGTAGGTWAAPTTNNSTQGWSTSATGVNAMSGTMNTTTADALNFGTGTDGLATGTITVSGNVSAAGITFGNATGNITLSGGSITLNGLLYRLGSATNTQTINSDIVLVGARQFGANQLNEKLLFGGNISGSGASLTLDTNPTGGLVTLNGTNSFSGNLSIARGQLNINSVSAKLANSALGAGSKIIAGSGGGQGPVLHYTGSSNGSTNRDIELNVSGGGSLTITSQNAALTLSGTAMNTVANGNGILNLSGDAGGGANINHFSGAIQDNGNSTMSIQLLSVTPTSGSAENGFWKLSGTNTYSGTTTVTNASTLIVAHSNALGATANGTSIAANGQLLLDGGISVGGEALTLNSGAGSNWNGQTLAALRSYSGNNSWAGAITIGQATTIATNLGAGLTLSGGISGSFNLTFNSIGDTNASGNITTSTGTLTKSGNGSLTISGANTYTGATLINTGTLQIGAGGTSGSLSTSSTITNNGTLVFNRSDAFVQGTQFSSAAIGGTGSVIKNGAGNLTLNAANTYTGATTINAGTLSIASITNGGVAGALGNSTNSAGNLVLGGGSLLYTGSNGSTDRNFTLTASTSSEINVSNAATTLTISGTSASTNGTLVKNGSGTLVLSGNNSHSGATMINAGTLQIGDGGTSGSLSTSTAITNNGTFVFNRSDALVQGTQFSSATIGGTGSVIKNGAGNLTLNAANTYTGATTINAGTLSIASITNGGVAGALGNSTNAAGNLILGGGSLLYTGSNGSTDRNFTLAASTSSEINVSNAVTTLTISGTSASTNGALTKNGSGTLVLSGNNSHSGATTINAGTLVLSGTNTGSAITINSGGSLLSGTSLGSTAVNSGGKIGPGASANSIGSLTVAGLTLNSGGAYTWDMSNATGAAGTGWDRIASNGLLTVGATSGSKFSIAITSSGVPTNWDIANSGLTWDIITYGSLSGFAADKFTLDTSAFGGALTADSSWALSDTGSALRLTYTYTASTPTWAGTTGNWSTGFSPAITTGGNVSFVGAGGAATNNIASGNLTSVGSITFSGTGAYTLQANSGSAGFDAASALQLNGNIVNSSAAMQTINLALTSNSTRVYDAAGGNITIGNAISGTGGLTKNGTGTLTLSGNSTYSGATTINSGTLKAGSTNGLSSGSAVSVAAGAILDLGGFNNTISSLSTATGTVTDSSSAGNGGILRILSAMPSATTAQLFTGSMGLQLFGGSTFDSILSNTANTYSGGTIFGNGTGTTSTRVFTSGTIGAGTPGALTSGIYGKGAITIGASATDRSQLYFVGTTIINNNIVVNSAVGLGGSDVGAFRFESSGNILAGAINANLADATFSATNGAGRAGTVTGTISGASGVTVTTSGAGAIEVTLNNAGTANSYAGNTTINTANSTLTLGRADQISNGAGKGNLVINSGTFKMGGFSETINGLSGNGTIDGVSGTPTLTIGDNDATTTFSGVIKNASGTLALTKTGNGTLTLSGNNTYSGATTVNAGTLTLGASDRIGDSSNLDVAGGTFNLAGYNESLGSIAGSGNITLGAGTLTSNSSSDSTFSGLISGTGALVKSGSGVLTLSGNNTQTGAITISAGTLQIASTGLLGGGSYSGNIANSGVLIAGSNSNQSLSGVISGTGALSKNGSGVLTFSGNNTYTGGTTINTGTLHITSTGLLGGGSYSGNMVNSSAIIVGSDSNQTFSGIVSGTGALTKNGTGVLTLSSNNTYAGGTTINAGTLIIGNVAAAGTGTIIQASSSSLLKLNTAGTISNTISVYNVQASQSATLSGAISVNNASFDVDGGNSLTLSGVVSGSGGIAKNGAGTLVLSGSNTYAAATTVNVGTLNAAHASALGSNTTVQVNGGSLLVTADDAINGKNITLNSTATGGASAASLAFSGTYNGTAGSLTLNADSIIDLGTGSVALHFSNMAMGIYNLAIYNWTGTTLWGGGNGNNTDQFYVDRAVSSNELNRISFYSGISSSSFVGTAYQLSGGSFNQEIIPVPEPETYAVPLILLLGFGIYALRRLPEAQDPV